MIFYDGPDIHGLTNFETVTEWHEKFGAPVGDKPQMLTPDRELLRMELIREEFQEYRDALTAGDIVEAADALGDLLWVVYGAGVEHGFPMDEIFEAIACSNFSKLGDDGKPILREDGKILKGPNFFGPNLRPLVGLDD